MAKIDLKTKQYELVPYYMHKGRDDWWPTGKGKPVTTKSIAGLAKQIKEAEYRLWGNEVAFKLSLMEVGPDGFSVDNGGFLDLPLTCKYGIYSIGATALKRAIDRYNEIEG